MHRTVAVGRGQLNLVGQRRSSTDLRDLPRLAIVVALLSGA
jgi:hypothetical protein